MTLDRFATAAAFPLGGIGTGNFSIGSRGEFRDWELANRPDKGNSLPFTFFAIRAKPAMDEGVTRVLESRLVAPHAFDQGYSVPRVGGLPRLRESRMTGEYPLLSIAFEDDVLPVNVELEAFTPLVPLETADSGIPAAVLRFHVSNPSSQSVSVSIVGSMSNPVGGTWTNESDFPEFEGKPFIERHDDGALRGLRFRTDLPSDHPRYGDVSMTTRDESVSSKRQWLVGFWQDGVQSFWNDFRDDGLLQDEPVFSLDTDLPPLFAVTAGAEAAENLEHHLSKLRVGSLAISHELGPGECRTFEYYISWSFPNRPRGWAGHIIRNDPQPPEVTRNHYATRFADSWAAARYLAENLERLEGSTRAFHAALFGGSLDLAVVDALSANISALRSTTCFLLEDGTFAAWEGSFDRFGSCEGTCTHVWSYAQTAAYLFPQLERSARRIEFLLETDEYGAMQFRTNRVFGGAPWGMLPAVDGQCGSVVRLYREWRFSGDDVFLDELWPAASRALDFAMEEWDTDGDGALDAPTHNTYDIEFRGVEPLANVYFLAALRAGSKMAAHLGNSDAAKGYAAAAVRGSARVDELLYNGEYYQQRIADVDEHRYQYGAGVLSDQLLGQSVANLLGLGYLLPLEHVKSAINSVYQHNFRHDLSAHESTQRTFALNDEGGLLLASWPRGGRPKIPFIYSDEVWTGIEYQVASHLISEGFVEEGLQVVRTTRARYAGHNRNPWNEIECGNHYARSMASWGLLLALSGVQYDAPSRSIGFDPAEEGDFASLFTTATAWGRVEVAADLLSLRVDHGVLRLSRVTLRGIELSVPAGGIELSSGESVRLRQ